MSKQLVAPLNAIHAACFVPSGEDVINALQAPAEADQWFVDVGRTLLTLVKATQPPVDLGGPVDRLLRAGFDLKSVAKDKLSHSFSMVVESGARLYSLSVGVFLDEDELGRLLVVDLTGHGYQQAKIAKSDKLRNQKELSENEFAEAQSRIETLFDDNSRAFPYDGIPTSVLRHNPKLDPQCQGGFQCLLFDLLSTMPSTEKNWAEKFSQSIREARPLPDDWRERLVLISHTTQLMLSLLQSEPTGEAYSALRSSGFSPGQAVDLYANQALNMVDPGDETHLNCVARALDAADRAIQETGDTAGILQRASMRRMTRSSGSLCDAPAIPGRIWGRYGPGWQARLLSSVADQANVPRSVASRGKAL